MKRRDFIKQTSAALTVASFSASARALPDAKTAAPLNLLFLTVDDMDYSMPGFMGGKYNLTPHLDSLAARSFRFVNNRTTAPICQPSREAMMTGLIPHHSGALGFNPVHPGTTTLSSLLAAKHYYSKCIHKRGHMAPESCFPWTDVEDSTDRNPDVYEDGVRSGIARARQDHKPFFICCNLNDPHRPFYGSELAAEHDHHEEGPYRIDRVLTADDVQVPRVLEGLPDIRTEYAQYCNNAQRMDKTIGKVLKVLADSGAADHTIVFFSADHGMPFPFSKATVYDHGTRTPALLSWPGMGAPRTFTERTCNIDYLPTLLEVLGMPVPPGLDGHSWMPIIKGEHDAVDREYLVTHVTTLNSGAAYPMRALQNDRFSLVYSPWADGKLMLHCDAMQGLTYKAMARAAQTNQRLAERTRQYAYGIPLALYDLQADPDQRINALEHPEHKAQAATMKALLLDYMERTQDPELKNFRILLAGGKPVVVQPARQANSEEAEKS